MIELETNTEDEANEAEARNRRYYQPLECALLCTILDKYLATTIVQALPMLYVESIDAPKYAILPLVANDTLSDEILATKTRRACATNDLKLTGGIMKISTAPLCLATITLW